MIQVKTLGQTINDVGSRVVKVLRFGRSDVQTANQVTPAGIDAGPIKDLIAVYSSTSKKGSKVIIGYISKNAIAESGELRLYSQDDQGAEQGYVYLKKDGTLELLGDTDYAIRYSEMKTAFDTLRDDLNALLNLYNAHIHPTPAGPSSVTVSLGTPSAADMTASKIDEIKVP